MLVMDELEETYDTADEAGKIKLLIIMLEELQFRSVCMLLSSSDVPSERNLITLTHLHNLIRALKT